MLLGKKWHLQTCLRQGCHKPSICKNAVSSKCNIVEHNKMKYACIFFRFRIFASFALNLLPSSVSGSVVPLWFSQVMPVASCRFFQPQICATSVLLCSKSGKTQTSPSGSLEISQKVASLAHSVLSRSLNGTGD